MAAPKKSSSSGVKLYKSNPKKNRKGVHKKSKASKHKGSKNYKKAYKGQGR
jgi:hypothetical protein